MVVATVVIVLGNERLYASLSKRCKAHLTHVLKLPKSGGVVTQHDAAHRRRTAMARVRDYFYGRRGELCPYSYVVPFKDMALRRIGEGTWGYTVAPLGKDVVGGNANGRTDP